MLPAAVRRSVDAIWDRIWASGVSNPLTAIEYFSTVLLLRRIADGSHGEGDVDDVWSRLIDSIDKGDADAVAALMASVQRRFGIGASPDVASPATWSDLTTLRTVLKDVSELRITDRNKDMLGDLFEFMLNRLGTAGHFGQFRTPRHLIKFMVNAVNPRSGEVVVDPACGTYGFLIAAHEHRGGSGEPYIGNEVDATMVRIAKTNAILHRMSGARINHGDSLQVKDRDSDVILANPPFAGAVAADRVVEFESGTLKTELLFIELMMRRLKEGGRAAVVVPTGVLTSSASAAVWVRRQLVENNHLCAVIELPGGVFRPYTGVKTGLLFWSNEPSSEDVLMVRVESDGYSLDDKREPVDRNDLPDALRLLDGEHVDLPHARVSVAELRKSKYNLSPSRYIAGEVSDDFGLSAASLADALASARRAASAVLDGINRVEGLLR